MFTKRNILGFIVLIILSLGLAAGVYLSQRQTQLKSKASEQNGSIGFLDNPVTKNSNGSWNPVRIEYFADVRTTLWYRGASCAGIPNCGGDNIGWIQINGHDGGGGVGRVTTWTPPNDFQPGSSTGILLTDLNSVHLFTAVLDFAAAPAPTATVNPTVTAAPTLDLKSECTTFNITNSSGQIIPVGGPLFTDQAYNVAYTFTNKGSTGWNNNDFKIAQISDPDTVPPRVNFPGIPSQFTLPASATTSNPIPTNGLVNFNFNINTPSQPTGGNPSQLLFLGYQMQKSGVNFGSACFRAFQVQVSGSSTVSPTPPAGGTGACSGSAGTIGGVDRIWTCVNTHSSSDGSSQSPPMGCTSDLNTNLSCSVGLSCYPCLASVGGGNNTFDFNIDTNGNATVGQGSTTTQTINFTRTDSNIVSPVPTVIVTDPPPSANITYRFRNTSCLLSNNAFCSIGLQIQTGTNVVPGTYPTLITATSGSITRTRTLNVIVTNGTTSQSNFTISTPQDITLAKGGSDSGRNITVTKTSGNAEDIALSIFGSMGGATANFQPSNSCTPDNSNQCQRVLSFNTVNATPGDYPIAVQGRSASGQTNQSQPFHLKITGVDQTEFTSCFVVSEDRNKVNAINNNTICQQIDGDFVRSYSTDPTTIPYTFKTLTPETKTVYVKFISNKQVSQVYPVAVKFSPGATISSAECTHLSTGVGTRVTITGANFGPQNGSAKVMIGSQEATIISWDQITNTIIATVDQRLSGKNNIVVTPSSGRVSNTGSCTIGLTTVDFTASIQCKTAVAVNNVSVKVYENSVPGTSTVALEPILSQTINLDSTGKPQGFAPSFEKGKNYSLIIKAPGTLAKRVDFRADSGTKQLNKISLLVGDISPINSPDGIINAFDKSELIRQWNLTSDVVRTGDFNNDGRVNSLDYSCMRGNSGQIDNTFIPSLIPLTPIATTTPPVTATITITPTATLTLTPTPTVPAGTLPFRVSLNSNFLPETGNIYGDMGTDTQKVVDLSSLHIQGTGNKDVYIQFFENGAWGSNPPQKATILVNINVD